VTAGSSTQKPARKNKTEANLRIAITALIRSSQDQSRAFGSTHVRALSDVMQAHPCRSFAPPFMVAPHMPFAGVGESNDAFFWLGATHAAIGKRLTSGAFLSH
jgi:hypothetical protein